MSNTWFRFRQFEVHQDRCGMKVSTDACIQGAWTPLPATLSNALDIGTGTGLLSLMLAQRAAGVSIDAVELDEAAAGQAAENFQSGPWKDRLRLHCGDVLQLRFEKQYELILCNPPFFQKDLQSPETARNQARHAVRLNLPALLELAGGLLTASGRVSLLLPAASDAPLRAMLPQYGFQVDACLKVFPSVGKPANRIVYLLSKEPVGEDLQSLFIRDAGGGYTEKYKELMRDFYL